MSDYKLTCDHVTVDHIRFRSFDESDGPRLVVRPHTEERVYGGPKKALELRDWLTKEFDRPATPERGVEALETRVRGLEAQLADAKFALDAEKATQRETSRVKILTALYVRTGHLRSDWHNWSFNERHQQLEALRGYVGDLEELI